MQRIGFVGTGLMGRQMAGRLLAAGFPVAVWNRTRAKAAELLAAGATWGESPRRLAEGADVAIAMLTDSAASEAVFCGPEGLLAGSHPGLTLIDMGSVAPETSRRIAERARAAGVPLLDAPVTGNPQVAAEGRLGIMVGGPEESFEACLPVFRAMGVKILHVGENGKGTTLKLINNLILGVAIQAVAEALVLAHKAGIDPARVQEITSVGGARTGAMETRGGRMIRHDFSPHFSANNMHKDLSAALRLAEEVGVSLPATSVAREMLRAVKSRGEGEADSCAVITVLEALAHTTLGGPA